MAKKQIHLAAHFPGVNNTTGVSRRERNARSVSSVHCNVVPCSSAACEER